MFRIRKSDSQQYVTTQKGCQLFGVDESRFTNWRWQMKHQIQSPEDFQRLLPFSDMEVKAFEDLKKVFHAGLSPYAASLIDFNNPNDPIRLQLVPDLKELSDSYGVPDPLQEINNSPVKELVHVYKHKIAWCVAQICPIYCRYCFRKRRDEEIGLHFNAKLIDAGLQYIKNNKDIHDVLITGGDPFIAHDSAIKNLLVELRKISHVQIIRFGTRVPVYLPYRITKDFAEMLAEFHPIWINTHFNSPAELTEEAGTAIDHLLRAGIPVGNQSVFLNGVNDSLEVMQELLRGLIQMRVRPYYIYHPQIVDGTEHLRIPIEKGLDIMKNLRGSVAGFAIPQYVLDTPSGKVPLSPNHIVGRKDNFVLVEQLNGKTWAEPSPLQGYEPKISIPDLNSSSKNAIANHSVQSLSHNSLYNDQTQ